MIALPFACVWFGAAILALFDGRRRSVGWLAVLCLAGCFASVIALAYTVLRGGPVEMVGGGWPVGIGIALRADALGVLFAMLSIGVLLVVLTYDVLQGVRERALPASILFLATGLTGLFLTGDAFNFYVFFEVSMAASFVLATMGRHPRRNRAALIFTVVNLLGSAIFLSAIVALYHVTGTLDMNEIAVRMAAVEPTSAILTATLIFVAFSLKLGLFPFHLWVPTVYRDTLPSIAAILSGALANIGSYGLLRFGGQLLPSTLEFGAPVVIVLGAASILYGAVIAITRRSASEVLAYSSIGQVGYVLVALAIGGPVGYGAAILYAVINSLNKTLLFLSTGLRGWLVGASFVVGALSVAGLPPSLGFFGKAALFVASIRAESPFLVGVVLLGGALSILYMFRAYQQVFWIAPHAEPPSLMPSRVIVFALACLIVALGVWPEPLVAVSQQAADAIVGRSP